MKSQPNAAALALTKASKDLRMPSETDAPFEVLVWDDTATLTSSRLLELAQEPKEAAVEVSSLDDLFATVPSEDQAKFQSLRQVILAQLSEVKVYKVGEQPEREIYIVGKSKDGKLVGLKTVVVET
jgi:Nuclease A inhibitor-like protein